MLTVHPLPIDRQAMGAGGPSATSPARHVLAPVDFSLCSLDALDYAALLAMQFGARLTVLYVMEPVLPVFERGADSMALARYQQGQAASRLADLCHELRGQGIVVETAIGRGNTAEAILAETNRRGCDLVVMGTRGRRGFASLIGGSVAEGVLRQATLPVLTVKRLHILLDARCLSSEIRILVGDEAAAGERTH